MGGSYVEQARENHVKKKVEEETQILLDLSKPHVTDPRKVVDFRTTTLRSKMKAKALNECDQYVSKYAECATGRTFSVVWTCRKQAKELNTCLHQFTNDKVLEEMKREYTLQEEGKLSASTT